MPITIALAGKGGVGKTTIAALIIKCLTQTQPGPVLAIDADPSSNLNMALGLDLEWTVGDIREGMLTQAKQSVMEPGAAMGGLPGGISKHDYLDYQIRSALTEGRQFDLIAMGRGEGKGCYCAVNHTLREVIDAIGKHYAYVVIDNEAGLEHLSRGTTRDVQHLLIVSDATLRGLAAAERIAAFQRELDIRIEKAYLILNGVAGDLSPAVQARLQQLGVPLLGVIPRDAILAEFDTSGQPLVEVNDDTPVCQAVRKMLNQILQAGAP